MKRIWRKVVKRRSNKAEVSISQPANSHFNADALKYTDKIEK